MTLSLVTGTYGRTQCLDRLVASILERTTVDYELVIADANDKPSIFSDGRIRVLHELPRMGHSRGYNRAFRACAGEYILWLNDDAEVCEGYDVAALNFMRANPRIGLGALHYSETGGEFRVNAAWGTIYANFGIFRKEVGELVGYFDEDISMYGADNSLALRILMADYGIADIPEARIIHHSERDGIRRENQQMRARDNKVLSDKYMPYRRQWTQNFKKHYIFSGHAPWTHGVRPEKVMA